MTNKTKCLFQRKQIDIAVDSLHLFMQYHHQKQMFSFKYTGDLNSKVSILRFSDFEKQQYVIKRYKYTGWASENEESPISRFYRRLEFFNFLHP